MNGNLCIFRERIFLVVWILCLIISLYLAKPSEGVEDSYYEQFLRFDGGSDRIALSEKTHKITGTISLDANEKIRLEINNKPAHLWFDQKAGLWRFSLNVALSMGTNDFDCALIRATTRIEKIQCLSIERIPEVLNASITIDEPHEGINSQQANNIFILKGKITGGKAPWNIRVHQTNIKAYPDGTFKTGVKIAPGVNEVPVTITDSKGKKINYLLKVTADIPEFRLLIKTPLEYETSDDMFTVKGMVIGGWGEITIRAKNHTFKTFPNNHFHISMPLQDGINDLIITASDEAGRNVESREVKIVKKSPIKPSDMIAQKVTVNEPVEMDVSNDTSKSHTKEEVTKYQEAIKPEFLTIRHII